MLLHYHKQPTVPTTTFDIAQGGAMSGSCDPAEPEDYSPF